MKKEESKQITNLSANALDYLDNIIFDDEDPVEESKEKKEKPVPAAAPPK